jgi:HK97 family phage portal protein
MAKALAWEGLARSVGMASRAIAASLANGLAGGGATGAKALNPVPIGSGGWYPIIRESYTGAWQQNVEVNAASASVYHAVFGCMTLIASDIAKLALRLVGRDDAGIWTPTRSASFSPVLRKPNPAQNRIQFVESWVLSKLSRGNTLVLKRRDERGVVIGLYVLNWDLCRPLVADNGEIFYELRADNVAGIKETIFVPAREVIHDRFNCLFHPLVGLSPIVACGLTATQGLRIQESATKLYQNGARPSGILTANGTISDETAQRLKAHWDTNYTGENAGKVAVVGDGLKFEALTMKSTDAQLIEQLRWTAEVVCSTFHVPPYKLGIGTMPALQNIQALNVEYYTQALQILIESIELCLDEGLGLGEGSANDNLGVEFDLDGLLRMDSVTQMDVLEKGRNYLKPNEGRLRINLGPVEGGDQVYRQQQDYSLAALAKRDAAEDPFGGAAAASVTEPEAEPDNDNQAERANAAAAKTLLTLTRRFRRPSQHRAA